jgi:hypothetical protein
MVLKVSGYGTSAQKLMKSGSCGSCDQSYHDQPDKFVFKLVTDHEKLVWKVERLKD